MGYRYNSPPTWPAPPSSEWVPPQGWKPDATWPPAPDGWNFWLEDPDFVGPPAAATPAPRQNRIRERLHTLMLEQLEPDEELRWYSVVYEYKAPPFIVGLFAWSILLPMIGPLIAMLLRRPWYVGVTNRRVIFFHDHSKTKDVPTIGVPLGTVSTLRKGRKTGKLLVAGPPDPLPEKFTLFRGPNIDELEALLGTRPVSSVSR